jgi:hypothetical protein
MKAATIHELKKELSHLSQGEVIELCLRLARFKKENKELLNYLLFEAHDEHAYIKGVNEEVSELFTEIPKGQGLYLAKKSIRKILRIVNKYARYSGNKATEVELRLHYCATLAESGIAIQNSTALYNLYLGQLKKIKTLTATFHEDLQYDYNRRLEELE